MTKAKALKLLQEYGRCVVAPQFAQKLAKSFGFTLTDLGFEKEKKYSLSNAPMFREITATGISISHLAKAIVKKIYPNADIGSSMHGAGSWAEDITRQAVELLSLIH